MSEPSEYYLGENEWLFVLALNDMLALARSSKRPGTRLAAYRCIGEYLRRLREGRDQAEWLAIVQSECGLSKTHAYRIMGFSRKFFPTKSMGENRKIQQNQRMPVCMAGANSGKVPSEKPLKSMGVKGMGQVGGKASNRAGKPAQGSNPAAGVPVAGSPGKPL
jgi:hypothetical protein